MSYLENEGTLELIIGPMYAGKSTELLRILNKYKTINKNIIVINHIFNNRYECCGISTHSKETYNECINLNNLSEIDVNSDFFQKSDLIIIEELQFFNDAFENITLWCDKYKKNVVGVGLDGDFQRNPFENIAKLIPHAEKITKLNALCIKCSNGTIASFSKRTIKDDSKIVVGSSDIYEAVCRKHYLENV